MWYVVQNFHSWRTLAPVSATYCTVNLCTILLRFIKKWLKLDELINYYSRITQFLTICKQLRTAPVMIFINYACKIAVGNTTFHKVYNFNLLTEAVWRQTKYISTYRVILLWYEYITCNTYHHQLGKVCHENLSPSKLTSWQNIAVRVSPTWKRLLGRTIKPKSPPFYQLQNQRN